MAGSDSARNSAYYLREAGDTSPNEPETANVLATIGVGHALLAIADSINKLAETIAEQNERN